jgi:F0F1-type ATP synthase delta subunit
MRGKAGFLTDLDRGGTSYDKSKDESNKDIEKLRELFQVMPAPAQMLDCSSSEESLREFLIDAVGMENGKLMYQLLRYIIATNRLALFQLQDTDKIPDIPDNIK